MNEKALLNTDRERDVQDGGERLLQEGSTLVEILERRAKETPTALAYAFLKDGEIEDGRLTYAELSRRARALAVWLRRNGAAGDRALLLYPPGLDFLVGFFGCLYAGVVAVPLYPPRPNRRDSRIVDVARDAGARSLLTNRSVAAQLDRALTHSPELAGARVCATDEIPDEGAEAVWESRWTAACDEVAYLQYTSGSTRSPNGVMVSQANVFANILHADVSVGHPPGSVFVTWLPHFHDMGLVYGLLAPLSLGSPCHLMPPASFLQHPRRWLSAISRYRGTHSGGPNFAYELCAQRVTPEQKRELDLSSWRVAFNGAEPIRAATLDAFASAFAVCGFSRRALCPAYGLAEATLLVTVNEPEREPLCASFSATELARGRAVRVNGDAPDAKTVVGCGRPGSTEVLIVDGETKSPCGPDGIGEIWLRGPSVARGYWSRPEETRDVFEASPVPTDGAGPYMRTGDLGFLSEGELFVTGRLKDLIIIRGRNHYPQDIELTTETSHPLLRGKTAAAFSMEVRDEERLIVVQELDRRHVRSVDVRELGAAVRRAITEEHEVSLHRLVLVGPSGIPKTSSGKVQRRACARALLEGSLRIVAEWTEELPEAEDPLRAVERARPRAAGTALRAEDIEDFISRRLSAQLGLSPDELDLEQPFESLGMDSARALTFLGELETWLGRRLSPTLFWNYPTVGALARHLSQSSDEDERDSG